MTTRRDFLKMLGAGAAVAALPVAAITKARGVHLSEIIKDAKKMPPGAIFNKPEYPRCVIASTPVICEDNTVYVVKDHGLRIQPNDVLLNLNTREQILVLEVRRDVLSVQRGFASFPYAITSGDRLLILQSAYAEV